MSNQETPTPAALVAEARELDSKATPGPWIYTAMSPWDDDPMVQSTHDDHFSSICRNIEMDDRPHDMEFIAASRTLVPQLCDAVDALQAELAERDAEIESLRGELESERAGYWNSLSVADRDRLIREAGR